MKDFRKLFFLTLASCTLFSTSQVLGVLPPLYSTLNHYKVLLTSPQLTEKLDSGELIEDIKLQDNSFLITTSKHTLQVDVEYDHQPMPGPARFHLIFHNVVPLKHNEELDHMKEQPVDIQPEAIQHEDAQKG
ncbi:MAG: hypothetical protein WCF65_04175 [Parachlamydiaceae bacterium]